jgi:hypothetical protein
MNTKNTKNATNATNASTSKTTRPQIRTNVRAGEMGAVSQGSQYDRSNYYANVGSYFANSTYGSTD